LKPLSLEDTFVRQWGDMGAVWGINRTMAEIQGLLYISGATLSTDDIIQRLGISRGNASMSLRALVAWGIVRKVHRRSDRKDYYQSLEDVWEIFSIVALQRKRREIDPIITALRKCQEDSGPDGEGTPAGKERLAQMLNFLSIMEALASRFVGSEDGLAKAVDLLGSSQ
jgi:DNA-binding transcriptional regulator GbsR (MarR family)